MDKKNVKKNRTEIEQLCVLLLIFNHIFYFYKVARYFQWNVVLFLKSSFLITSPSSSMKEKQGCGESWHGS